jgi:hypothetical protein
MSTVPGTAPIPPTAYETYMEQFAINGCLETPGSQFSTFTFAEEFAFLFPHVNNSQREQHFNTFVAINPDIFWTLDEIEESVSAHVEFLFNAREVLKYTVVRYEDLIRSRWMKKSRAQRRQILLEAWPDIAPKHRPDLYRYLGSAHYISS